MSKTAGQGSPFDYAQASYEFLAKQYEVKDSRGLWCVHEPNLYRWEALRQAALSEARISPKSGDLVLAPDRVESEDRHRPDRDAWLSSGPEECPGAARDAVSNPRSDRE